MNGVSLPSTSAPLNLRHPEGKESVRLLPAMAILADVDTGRADTRLRDGEGPITVRRKKGLTSFLYI